MAEQLEDVVKFINEVLIDAGVKFVIVGGLAVSVLGRSRATSDVDVVLAVDPSQVASILDEIEARGITIDRRVSVEQKLVDGYAAKIIWSENFSLDLRLASYEIDAISIKNAEPIKVFGLEVMIPPAEALIVYKLARFSGLDRSDIRGIVYVNSKNLDWDMIRNIAEGLAKQISKPKIIDNLDKIELKMRRR